MPAGSWGQGGLRAIAALGTQQPSSLFLQNELYSLDRIQERLAEILIGAMGNEHAEHRG
jgi:hypothetical protein